jgi:hypothetical protein
MLNTPQLQPNGTVPSSRFFSGDWKYFADFISPENSAIKNKYDCILTSETIYNPDNHKKLLAVFKQCLMPDGVMYPLKLYLLHISLLINLHKQVKKVKLSLTMP